MTLYLPCRAAGLPGGATSVQWRQGQAGPMLSGPLSALPRGTAVRVVVDIRDAWLGRLEVPPVSGKRLKMVLPGAIEDRVAVAAQGLHMAVSDLPGDQAGRSVAAVDRGWLGAWLQRLEGQGLKPAAVVPLPFVLPLTSGGWTVRLSDGVLAIRTSPDDGTGCAVADLPSALVVMEQAFIRYGPPARLLIQAADGALAQALASALAGRVAEVAVGNLSDSDAVSPVDLLQFEFARGARWMRRALGGFDAAARRRLLALVGAIAMVWVAGLNLDWLRQQRAASALRQDIVAQFRASFPQTPVVLDPVVQMQQELGRLRARSGSGASDDPLGLMGRVAGPLASVSQTLETAIWQSGELRLTYAGGTVEAALRNLQPQASALGLKVRQAEDSKTLIISEAR